MGERITVHNLADLKNTTDDAIPNYLNSLKFKQLHTKVDVRLALGYGAFAVAASCFLWDYKFGFESTKWLTAAAVALYSLLNGALTLWIWLVEKGTVYEGEAPDGGKIEIASSTTKNIPVYNLKITMLPKSGAPKTISISRSFTEWFDEQGHFVTVPFQQMLATGVPLVGKLDPKRVVVDSKVSKELLENSPEVLDAILAASGASAIGSSTAAEASAKKAGKRRKA